VIRLQQEEQGAISQYIHALCGVTLDSTKGYLIEGRLGHLAEESGCASFTQLISRAKSEPARALERQIINAITTNETTFFRDPSTFDLLRHKLLPDLVDRRRKTFGARIRIWSAACSTGQEVYSIAIALKEVLGDPERYGVSIHGTDISDAAVASASRGFFSDLEISRGMPDQVRDRFFARRGSGWQVSDEIRALASFQRLNLLQDFTPLGRFDIVFCRNVAIYFNDADRRALFARLARSLEPDGCLLVGSMESLHGVCEQLHPKRHVRAIYYDLT
jgi:chemotaxis protein methyltransferase CheR